MEPFIDKSNVAIQLNVALLPFGQASLMTGYAHPARFSQNDDDRGITITQVMPLMSSAITPGYSRPIAI
jgi:hypothetical protein